jgi:hypothetical protein
MTKFKFGTAINCIDGRTQDPVIGYIKQKNSIDGDMIEPREFIQSNKNALDCPHFDLIDNKRRYTVRFCLTSG